VCACVCVCVCVCVSLKMTHSELPKSEGHLEGADLKMCMERQLKRSDKH